MRTVVMLAVVGAACTPSSRGWTQSVHVGLHFTEDRTIALVELEVAAVAHEALDERTDRFHDPRWPHRRLGLQASGATGTTFHGDGSVQYAAVGGDLLNIYDTHATIGYGAQAVLGARAGISGAARLWGSAPVGRLWGAPLLGGLMLRVQGETGEVDAGGGPSLVVTRSRL